MKKSLLAMLMFMVFVSSTAFAGAPSSVSTETPLTKEQKKVERIQKFFNSKVGQWLIKRNQASVERKENRLASKLVKAEAKNDIKEITKIKKAQANLKKVGLWMMIGGVLALIIGFVIAASAVTTTVSASAGGTVSASTGGGFGFGAVLYILGGLSFTIGLILLIVGLVRG